MTAFFLLPDGRPSPSPFFPPSRLCEPAADDTASTTDRAERGRVELFFKGAEDKPTDRVHRRAANVTAKAVERRRRDESQGELGETAAHWKRTFPSSGSGSSHFAQRAILGLANFDVPQLMET